MVVEADIACAVGEQEVFAQAGVMEYAKHMVEQSAPHSHASCGRGNDEQHHFGLVLLARVMFQRLVGLQNGQLRKQTVTSLVACQQRQREAMSAQHMACPLPTGDIRTQRSENHAEHLPIKFGHVCFGGAGQAILHVDCGKSMHVAQTGRLA